MDPTNAVMATVAGAEFTLAIPPTPDQARTARLFAAAIARHFGYPEHQIEDVKLAISEACTNSIKAHADSELSETVSILVRQDGDRLRFDVVDAGPGFDLSTEIDEATVTPVAGLFEGSLGLSVIRSLFPDVEIRRNDAQGMTVSFTVERDVSS